MGRIDGSKTKNHPLIFICEFGPFLSTDTAADPQEHKAEGLVAGQLGFFFMFRKTKCKLS